MHNPRSMEMLAADRRLDLLVKKQAMEHRHLLEGHNKEMQQMREALVMAMEKFESLFSRGDKELKELKESCACSTCSLGQKIDSHASLIEQQRQSIDGLHKQMLSFQDTYSTKDAAAKTVKDLLSEIKASTLSHIDAFQEFQRQFKALLQEVQKDLASLRCDMDFHISDLKQTGEKNFYVARLDRDGVLKELRLYEKSMFIIEKKIENIYTLIDRLNERGSTCPKQE